MQQTKLLFPIYCLFIILLSSTFCIAEETTSTKYEWNIPTLAVISDINGNIVSQSCSKSKFSMTYNNSSDILKISTSDDTPLGSGDTIRNNVWLAAVSAALQRNETLSGWHISIDFSGNVDGPSSGAITALYILSALDGRTPPEDFAATGTIMPDGTIGPVGGVAYKLEAAAESGMKKVCIPAFIRFEPQPDGSLIDLAEKAEQLGIELILAENLEEAYAAMHDLPSRFIMVDNVKKICAIPVKTEKVIIELFLEKSKFIENIIKNHSEEIITNLPGDPLNLYLTAHQYFKAGQLLPALEKILYSYFWFQTYIKQDSFYKEYFKDTTTDFSPLLSDRPEYNLLAELSIYNDQKIDSYPLPLNNHYLTGNNISEFSAQFCAPNLIASEYGAAYYLRFMLPNEAQAQQLSDAELQEYLNYELLRIELYNCLTIEFNDLPDTYSKIAITLPQSQANSKLSACENFFFQAAITTCNDFERYLSEIYAIHPEELKSIFPSVTPEHSAYYFMYYNVIAMHNTDDKTDKYQKVASIIAQIELLCLAHSLMLQETSDSSMLSYLISSARNQALRSIRSCTNKGIVCLYSIDKFQKAETMKTSPIPSIALYWQAALSAKALQIIFE